MFRILCCPFVSVLLSHQLLLCLCHTRMVNCSTSCQIQASGRAMCSGTARCSALLEAEEPFAISGGQSLTLASFPLHLPASGPLYRTVASVRCLICQSPSSSRSSRTRSTVMIMPPYPSFTLESQSYTHCVSSWYWFVLSPANATFLLPTDLRSLWLSYPSLRMIFSTSIISCFRVLDFFPVVSCLAVISLCASSDKKPTVRRSYLPHRSQSRRCLSNTRKGDISIALIALEQFFTSVLFRDTLDVISLILFALLSFCCIRHAPTYLAVHCLDERSFVSL